MNLPNPALVSQQAAQRLPRWVLLLFCAAYVLPGLFGRDPWKNADLSAVGYMLALARSQADWLSPALGGLPADGGLLPYWLGAISIRMFDGLIDAPLAARLPFALLLAGTIACVWYGCYHLARTDRAQPLAFAFGGEADPIDYARAVSDAAVLAVIASLGLLQLGHETTPELLQLMATALLLYALAASPFRHRSSRIAALIALPALALSGAPATAVAFGVVGATICARSNFAAVRRFAGWVGGATGLAVVLGTITHSWAWRVGSDPLTLALPRLLLWFTWPVWPLTIWTLWKWRRQLEFRHIAVPLGLAATAVLSSAVMGGNDRALMLALPGMAILGAFALPTLKRSLSAAIDWFSVFFFTAVGLTLWVMYIAVQTGIPAKPAANVARLLPGFESSFSLLSLLLASLGTLAWAWLVRWRTGHHRRALWKSLILPAGGVAWSWLLAMTLWLPILDYARSYHPMVRQLARVVPADACVVAPNLSRPQIAALTVHGSWPVTRSMTQPNCNWMLVNSPGKTTPPDHIDGQPLAPTWQLIQRVRRPSDRQETLLVYSRR